VKELGRYRVVGNRAFRGHEPGTVFEAVLDERQEARAIARGTIDLLERIPADLPAGSYRLPSGWPEPQARKEVR
jgi:hypothetical protein